MNPRTISTIALAHHWLVTYRGGERVLSEFRELFPTAPLATLVLTRGDIPEKIIGEVPSTSPLQSIPLLGKHYKLLLPVHPWAFSRITLPYITRFVLSSDAAMVKGLQMPEGARQVCYCHSPPRYLWDLQDDYIHGLGWLKRMVFNWSVPRARAFDYAAAQRVDRFIANSSFVAKRIKRSYGRGSEVIYPPVAVADFSPDKPSEEFYLLVTQLTPYKRADLAVKAFNRLGKKLVVIGEGSEFKSLQAVAGPTVHMLGRQPFNVVKDHFERCRAFLYPQIEDFGITAVEAQAAGKPVIAFGAGGVLETVIEGQTGVFFNQQTTESLIDAVERFEGITYPWSSSCRRNAERFRPERFREEIKAFLTKHYPDLFEGYSWPV